MATGRKDGIPKKNRREESLLDNRNEQCNTRQEQQKKRGVSVVRNSVTFELHSFGKVMEVNTRV